MPTKIRCFKIHLKPSEHKKQLLDYITHYSKNVWNCGIYFSKKWYELRGKIIKYYLRNFDLYFDSFTINDVVSLLIYILSKDSQLVDEVNEERFIRLIKTFRKKDNTYIKRYYKRYPILEEYYNRYFKYMEEGGTLSRKYNYTYTILNLDIYELEEKNNKQFNTYLKDIKKMFNQEYNGKICNKIPVHYLVGDVYYRYVNNKTKNDTFFGSQCLQQTLKKIDDAYSSYYGSLNGKPKISKGPNPKKIYPKKPDYLDKEGKYNVIFQNNSFEIKKVNKKYMIVLKLGLNIKKQYDELFKDSEDIVIINKDYYIYADAMLDNALKYNTKNKIDKKSNFVFKHNNNLYYIDKNNKNIFKTQNVYFKIGKKIGKTKITEVELVPIHNGNNYNLILKYNKKVPFIDTDEKTKINIGNDNMLSIDCGMVNIVSILTSDLDIPEIIDGRYLIRMNKKINIEMDNYKSMIKKEYNSNTSVHYRNMLFRKENKIHDYMHKVSTAIIEYAKEKNIGTIIIGYNTNWKCNCNMGKENNRKFYEIPFRKLIDMIFYKGENNGILVKEVKESYTSKCDGLALEEINELEVYKGKRVKRGLFSSSTGHCINADVNGSLNILRKYVAYYRPDLLKKLENKIKNKVLINNLMTVKKTYFKTVNKKGIDEISLKKELLREFSEKLSRKYKRNLIEKKL